MKPNMGTVDKAVRVLLAFIIIVLYFTNQISGITAIILIILAVVFLLTSLLGHCPLYSPFGISTRKELK